MKTLQCSFRVGALHEVGKGAAQFVELSYKCSRCVSHNVAHLDIVQEIDKFSYHIIWGGGIPCDAYDHFPR